MNKFLTLIVFSSLFVVKMAFATAALNGVTINKININKPLGELLFIRTSTAPTIAGCQTNGDWNLVLKMESSLDDKIYAGLLAAQASQSLVNLGGSGTCSQSGIEYLNNFTIMK